MLGAADSGQLAMIAVLMVSSLLNVVYLLSIVARGFFMPSPESVPKSLSAAAAHEGGYKEAPLLCVLPPCLTAVGCLILFFYAGDVFALIEPIAATPEATQP